MQSYSYKLSDKDISLVKSTFRKLCENYYDNPSNITILHLLTLFGISQVAIKTPQQASSAGILPMLEILKVKAKGQAGNLITSINDLISYINSVIKGNSQKKDDIQNIVAGITMGSECPQLYTLSCTMTLRIIDINEYSNKITSQQQLEIVENIGKNCTSNPSLSIDLLLAMIKQKSLNILKNLVKSGIIKYLMNTYLLQLLQQTAKAQSTGKLNLYRLLKFLSLFGMATKVNFIKDRQKGLVNVIFNYEQYISVVKSILATNFDNEYSLSIYDETKNQADWIDKMYLWSYDESFSKLVSGNRDQCVSKLIKILQQKCSEDTQVKIYAILLNFSKNFEFSVQKIPYIPKYNKSIKSALKLINSLLQNDSTFDKLKKHIKKDNSLQKLEDHVQKSLDPQVPKIFVQVLHNIDGSHDKIKQLTGSKLDLFSQANAELLLERAGKIPKTKQDLKNFAQILQKKALKGEFQHDLLERAKQMCIQSIYRCILMKQISKLITPQQLNKLLSSLELSQENIFNLNRLLQILQIYMLKNPDWVNSINKDRVLKILDVLEQYSIKLNDRKLSSSFPKVVIDWGAAGQVLELLFGSDQWIKHIDSSFERKRMYWLLCAFEPSQNISKKLLQKTKNILSNKQHQTENQIILGFLSKSNQQLKNAFCLDLKNEISKNFSSEELGLNKFLMASYIVDKWSENQHKEIQQYLSKTFIPLIFKAIQKFGDNSDHVCQFLTAALPQTPSFETFHQVYEQIPPQYWLSKYGKFSTILYDSNPKNNGTTIITKGKVQEYLRNLSISMNNDFPDGALIMEILNFLKTEHRILSKEGSRAHFQSLIFQNVFRNYSGRGTKQQINWYWMLYPYYVSIMKHIIDILYQRINQTSSDQQGVQNSQILFQLLEINNNNKELTEEEIYEIIHNYRIKLENLGTKQEHSFTIYGLDIDKLRDAVNNIKQDADLNQQKQQLHQILDRLITKHNEIRQKRQQQERMRQQLKAQQRKRQNQLIENQKKTNQQAQKLKKNQQTSIKQEIDYGKISKEQKSSSAFDNLQQTSSNVEKSRFLQSRILNQKGNPDDIMVQNSKLGEEMNKQIPDFNTKLQLQDRNLDNQRQQFDSVEDYPDLMKKLLKQQSQKQISEKQLTFFKALKLLQKIVEGQQMPQKMNTIIPIFQKQNVPFKFKDTLGYLLAKGYPLWKDSRIIFLLLRKQKTLLSKQSCYSLLKDHSQTFVLSHRWKLINYQWLDLAMTRMKQPNFQYIAEACIVTQYNLPKIEDIEYFEKKKYHQTAAELITKKQKIHTEQQFMYAFLLIGTSARINDIRQFYLKKRVHLQILNQMSKHNNHLGVLSNGSYALSALIYLQSGQSTRLSTMKQDFEKIFDGYRTISKTSQISLRQRSLIQSSCSLLSNMTFNNDQVKNNLRQYKMIQLLMQMLLLILKSTPSPLQLDTGEIKQISESDLTTLKHIFRALGNCSVSELCAKDLMDQDFPSYSISLCQKIGFIINADQSRAKLLKLLMDIYANLTVHKYEIKKFHKSGVTEFVINLLQTTAPNTDILMGAIDTIDGLCQQPNIEKYAIEERNLSYILIDILKMQQDQKVITKSTRLLTNLTMNKSIIPKILEANLLSVLGNIVLLSHRNRKIQAYTNKIVNRVYNAQPEISIILKSGYLDCLVRCIETSQVIEDSHVDIMLFYAKHLPSFLNKRAFMCLIRVLIDKPSNKEVVDKCIKIFKILLSKSIDDDQEDLVIQGAPKMYQILLMTHPLDMLFLLGSHCIRSQKARHLMRKTQFCKVIDIINSDNFMNVTLNDQKNYNIAVSIFGSGDSSQKQLLRERIRQTTNIVSFVIFNNPQPILKQFTTAEQQIAFKTLKDRISCKLFRVDGSYKRARVDIDDEYAIRAYKYPEGEIKQKYYLPIRNIRDWRFHFQVDRSKQQSTLSQKQNKQLWNYTYFVKNQKGFFSQDVKMQNCVTIMGGLKWGHFVSINLQFQTFQSKISFVQSITILMSMFKS